MSKAYVNGVEVIIYHIGKFEADCYIPSLGIMNRYRLNQIEVGYVKD